MKEDGMDTKEEKISLKQQISNLKIRKRCVTDFCNSIINISKMGKEVFNSKRVKNLFTLNQIDESVQNNTDIQKEYLAALLKASTPNYKIDASSFEFNSKERISWMILAFSLRTNLSANENIKYIREYIIAEIGLEPTLIAIEGEQIITGYLFPNSPTTLQVKRLRKYNYFRDTRRAVTHILEAKWNVKVENYHETKTYSNFIQNYFYLSGNIFEIGMFQAVLDEYKNSSRCKEVTKLEKAYGGYKAGITKRAMPLKDRKKLTASANATRSALSIAKLQEVIKHIIQTEDDPNFSIKHIVKVSKEIGKNLSNKTVAKYQKELRKFIYDL
jgi:hypothetical protein